FPVYRLFLAATGIVVAVAIWQFLERSRLGLLIRATSQNADMASALGVDIKLIRSCVFGIGCGLAALGGVLAAPLVTASNGMAATVIIDAFVIVIIGGMGSFLGSVILGLFAMSLDLMFGYTRLVSFGHAAAYGFGAYACGWMLLHTGMPLLFAVFIAGLLTGLMGIAVGWMCTLATGVSFSMLTLAFAQLLYAISFKWTSVTGGSDGLAGIPRT